MRVFGEHFGENLRRIRIERGLSQTALAEAVGMNKSHISKLEIGLHVPRLSTVQHIAAGLGVSVEEFARTEGITRHD